MINCASISSLRRLCVSVGALYSSSSRLQAVGKQYVSIVIRVANALHFFVMRRCVGTSARHVIKQWQITTVIRLVSLSQIVHG
jgi:hypothetical protein